MSPRPDQVPEWLAREIMQRYERLFGEAAQPRPSVEVEEAAKLAELGYDGSRMRRRYWKKVRER